MPRRRSWSILALLALLATSATAAKKPASTAPAAPAAPDARALLDSVSANYARLERFHFEGLIHAEVSGVGVPQRNVVEVPFLYAAERPRRLRSESRNPFMTTVVVSDGDSLWLSAPSLQQYTVEAAPSLQPGGAGADPRAASLDPLMQFVALTRGLLRAERSGRDTVLTADGPIPCERVVVEYAPDSTRRGVHLMPRVLWIDEARRLLLRDSVTAEVESDRLGTMTNTQVTRFVVADDASGGPDSLYRFAPPAGSARVERLGPALPEPPDHAGEPAADFTLGVMDGKGQRVTLSRLRGKVVVLDFWATWCGPCRRWMPVVAKLHRELAGRDVRFYAVNLHEPVEKVRGFIRSTGVDVPVLLDTDGKVGLAYGAESIPLTVVVGRDGKIAKALLGVHPESDLRAALRKAGVDGI